jgi:hypothetical protein
MSSSTGCFKHSFAAVCPESFAVRRETGNEKSVQVRYNEGVAIHIDLEPCAVACKDGSEASAEEHLPQCKPTT